MDTINPESVILDEFLNDCINGKFDVKGWMHPLGFAHIKILVNGNDDQKIRLRIWETLMDAAQIGISNRIHNHAFDFTSFILCGDVLERRFDIEFDSFGSHRIWEVENLGGRSTLRKTSISCNLHEGQNIPHPSGSQYTMEAGAFHDAIAVSDITATLVFEKSRPDVASLVISSRDVEKITDNIWPEISKEEIIASIRNIVEKRLQG